MKRLSALKIGVLGGSGIYEMDGLIQMSATKVNHQRNCLCAKSLDNAIVIPLEKIDKSTLKNLSPVIGKMDTT